MKRTIFIHTLPVLVVTFFMTAGVSAQIRLAGNEHGLSVNGKSIDSGMMPERLHTIVLESLDVRNWRGFSVYDSSGSFPMRVKINEVTYEIWADRIVESCETRNARYRIDIQPDMVEIGPARLSRKARKAADRPIKPSSLAYSFKGDGEQVELVVNYGIPLKSAYHPSGELIEIDSDIRILLVDDQGEVLAERTRTMNALSANRVLKFPDRHLWVDTQKMQTSSGAHELLFKQAISGSDSTADVLNREIIVPDYNQAGLTLSDIMLAYSVEQTDKEVPLSENEILRKDLSILPAPRNVYLTEWPIYLYFEIYGLTLNAQRQTDYEIEIKLEPEKTSRGIRRLFKRKRDHEGVSVSYREGGSQSEEALYQILDINDQKTGPYTLTLMVRDHETGEESMQMQSLFLERSPCSN